MKRFINKLTGGEMWVADNREKEYLEAGHKLASDMVKPEINLPEANEEIEEMEKSEVKTKRARTRK